MRSGQEAEQPNRAHGLAGDPLSRWESNQPSQNSVPPRCRFRCWLPSWVPRYAAIGRSLERPILFGVAGWAGISAWTIHHQTDASATQRNCGFIHELDARIVVFWQV